MAESNLRLNVIMGMVDRITAPMQQVTSQTGRMSDEIKASQNELERLGTTSNDIAKFRNLKRGVADTGQEMEAAQRRVDALARQMREAENPSRSLTQEFNKARREVDNLRGAHDRENRELEETRRRLNDAGVSTKDLNGATRRIREETQRYTDDLNRQQKALDDVANRQKRVAEIQERNRGMRSSALMDTTKLTAGAFAVTRFTNAYGDLAEAQGEIASLGMSTEGIDAVTRSANNFSKEWAGTTAPEFIRASYDIRSGISSLSDAAVGGFTEIAALTGKATKSSTDQMTSLFATGYGIYRNQFEQFGVDVIDGWHALSAEERDMQFGEYFSAGIASAVQAYKTNGTEMSSAISSLGAAATSANVSFEEQLAILGTLQATMSGSEAATKYRSFLGSAAKAGDALGLSFMDTNNQLLTMPEILDQLRGKYGDTIDAVEEQELKKAFGTDEAVQAIKLLYDGVDDLRDGIGNMEDATRSGMATTEAMARAMNEGPSAAADIMKQRLGLATAALGQAFAPTVIAVSDAIGNAAMVVADLSERFPFLGQMLAFVIAGLGGAMAASIIARFAFAGLSDAVLFAGKMFNFLRWSTIKANAVLVATRVRAMAAGAATLVMGAAQRTVAAGMAIVTAAQWALNAAMTANPIGLLIVGIIALVAAVALIYRYWEPLTAFFSELWESIKGLFSAGLEYITSGLATAWDLVASILSFSPLAVLVSLWEPLPGFFSRLWDAVIAPWKAGYQYLAELLGFDPLSVLSAVWAPLVEFYASLWASVTGVFAAAWEGITSGTLSAWDVIKAVLSFSPLGLLQGLWEPLTVFYTALWDAVKAPLTAAWGYITDLLGFDPLGIVSEAWSPLVDFYAALWENITGIFGRALDWIGSGIMAPINNIKDSLGGAWNSLFGDDEAQVEMTQRVNQINELTPPDLRSPPPTAEGGGVGGAVAAPVGMVAASSGGTTVVDQSQHTTEIVVQQQPGQSAQDVGSEVRKQLDERDRQDRRRQRGRLVD